MPSPKFERVKREHRGVSVLLDRLAEYIRRQIAAHQDFIIPKLAAAALGINEGEAFVLLKIMAAGGLLRQQYNVYCRDKDIFIDSVDTLDDLDKIKYCDDCDTQHEPHELFAEIAFRPVGGKGAPDLVA